MSLSKLPVAFSIVYFEISLTFLVKLFCSLISTIISNSASFHLLILKFGD
jgi:hypothetical protein